MERAIAFPLTAAQPKSLADHLAAVRRRRWPAIASAVVILCVAFVAAMLWPSTFRSTGTILIEQQEVPVDLVRSMVSSYADQRIQVISQRVMTTENLLRIIDRYSLYPEDRRSKPREVLIQRMRDDITFSMISADVVDPRVGRPTKATIAFAVSFDSRSPLLAAKVANELTTLYLNENLQSRKQLADNAAAFLMAEGDRLSQNIAGLEAKIATFKEGNVDSLPERMQLNLQMLTRAEEELRDTDARVHSLEQQVVYLDAQLAQLTPAAQIYTSTGERVMSPSDRLKVLKSEYARASAIYAPSHPDVTRMKREIDGLEREVGKVDAGNDLTRQLQDAQSQLAQARERYAPDHPDIQQLERLVTAIERTMRESTILPATKEQSDNPAYIQVSAQREASLNERASLEGKRASLRKKIGEIESYLSHSPEIEREYSALLRDMDNAQLKYREVRQKQMEATVAQNLETERKGERFTLIEPPLTPEEPLSPNRRAIVLFGFVLAFALAVAVVFLLEALDTSVRGKRDLDSLLPVSALAILPWIDTPAERAGRARVKRFSLVGAATSIVLAVALMHFLYRPLDVLWQTALRRFVG